MAEITCTGGCACQQPNETREAAALSRRGVLTGSAAAVAAMALSACSSSSDAGGDAATPASDPASAPPSSPAPTADAGSPPASAVALAATDFPVGGGVVVTETPQGPVVVTQPSDGEYKGFSGTCPHQGCPVAEVLENTIRCNCHGSTFDASTGDRLGGPAPTGLDPVTIQVADGEIYLG